MAGRVSNLMMQLNFFQRQNRYDDLSKKFMKDMSEIIATQQNVESLMKYFDTVEPLNQWRTTVKKLETEKKELLQTNFVILGILKF